MVFRIQFTTPKVDQTQTVEFKALNVHEAIRKLKELHYGATIINVHRYWPVKEYPYG